MLRPIEAKDISFEWDRVRTGLLAIKAIAPDDWLPEDVYVSLRSSASTLYIGENDHGDYLGFLVLRLIHGFHCTKVEVWCAYSATSTPLMRRFFPEIQQLAKSVGASLISFSSSRDEWASAAKRLGFRAKQVNYEFTL